MVLFLACAAAWGGTGIGYAACVAIFSACLGTCPEYEETGQAYCQVQITASNCITALDLAIGTLWCVVCPKAEPQDATGKCPQGKKEGWRMWDIVPGVTPTPDSPTCVIEYVYQWQNCGDCPEELSILYRQDPV